MDIKTPDDPHVKVAEEGVKVLDYLIGGTFLVDVFPIRTYFPTIPANNDLNAVWHSVQ